MKTKQINHLCSLILLLFVMLMPQGAWADEITITITTDTEWDYYDIDGNDTVIVNQGVTVYAENININCGVLINYGTLKGQINCNGTLCNHGTISGEIANTGTFYNTGTYDELYLNGVTDCDHSDKTELGEVGATCTRGAGTQYECNVCHYIGVDATGEPLAHTYVSSNGINSCSMCGLTTYDAPAAGDGSATDPYQIANAGNLYWFADMFNSDYDTYCAKSVKLTADIVVNDGTFDADGNFTATGASTTSKPREWVAIGPDVWYHYYQGTFDGNGHTISGLYISDAAHINLGLMRYVDEDAVVKNLGVVNCYLSSFGDLGAICYENYGTITNCYSTGVITSPNNSNGGLCESNYGTISNCYSTCSVSAPYGVGGISVLNYGTISNCYFAGTVASPETEYCGGICGRNYDDSSWTGNYGSITNCYTTCDVACSTIDDGTTYTNVVANVSAETFSSGEIAYKLNEEICDGTQAWYQAIGTDSYPVLTSTCCNTVYYGYANDGDTDKSFYNTDSHDYDNGICTRCGDELTSMTTFAFADGTAYTRTTAADVTTLIYTRTITDAQVGKWQALYVPFAIPVETLSAYGMQVAELNDTHMYDDDDNGVFETVTIEFLRLTSGTTLANYPYLIRATEAGDKAIELTDVELNAAVATSIDCSTIKQKFVFTGTYTGVDGETMYGNNYYAIGGGQLVRAADSSAALKPQRWYMSVENRDGSAVTYYAPTMRLVVDGELAEEDEATALSAIADKRGCPSDAAFTITGFRVQDMSQPGIYVKNGKIVVRK